jgi:acid phosphatase
MLATTLCAGWLNITGNYLPRGDFTGRVQAVLTAVMMALAALIAATCAASWLRLLKSPRRAAEESGVRRGTALKSQIAVIFIGLAFCARAAAEDRLVFAVDLIRHGDRTPLSDIPAAPHQWAEGLGQLTAQGMRQEYELGSRMRSAYVDRAHLLPPRYETGTLYVRSSDIERTLMSAQSFLMGLYPHGTGPVMSGSGQPALPDAAQPIPIHTIAINEDSLLFPDSPANKFEDLRARYVLPSAAWKEKDAALRPRFAQWSRAAGRAITELSQLIFLGDTLFVGRLHHVLPPQGLSAEDVQTIIDAGHWALAAGYGPEQVGRVTGHELLKTIADYIEDASLKKTPLKYVLFSAHDTTILSELSALGAPLSAAPPYASRLNFSMFQSEGGDYSVKVSFNDRPVVIPACGAASCSLSQFLSLPRR